MKNHNSVNWTVRLSIFFIALFAMLIFGTKPSYAQDEVQNFAVGVDSTTTAVYGHRPVQTEVVVENISSETRTFSATVFYGGLAWGGENYPYTMTTNSEATWLECGTAAARGGCKYWWHGTLAPDEQASFFLQTFTGNVTGTFKFIEVEIASPFNLHVQRDLTITEGTGEPYGQITLIGGDSWKPGDFRGIQLELFAPKMTQFQAIKAFTATCNMSLPGGFVSSPNRTYAKFLWYHQLNADAAPGDCTIRAEIFGNGKLFTVEHTFQIEQILPEADLWSTVSLRTGNIQAGDPLTMTVRFGNNGPDPVWVTEIVSNPGQWQNEELLEVGDVVEYVFYPNMYNNTTYSASIGISNGVDTNESNNISGASVEEVQEDEDPIPGLELDKIYLPNLGK